MESALKEQKTKTWAYALIAKEMQQPLASADFRTMEKLDNIRRAAMLTGECRCRKLRMGEVEYSEELNKMGGAIGLWVLVIANKGKGRGKSRSKIKRLAKWLDIKAPLSVSLRQAELNRDKAT